jgi:hypothetical protein
MIQDEECHADFLEAQLHSIKEDGYCQLLITAVVGQHIDRHRQIHVLLSC